MACQTPYEAGKLAALARRLGDGGMVTLVTKTGYFTGEGWQYSSVFRSLGNIDTVIDSQE